MGTRIRLYMRKRGDYYEVYYVEPYTRKEHPIHSMKDREQAEVYLDGVLSGIGIVRKMIDGISHVTARPV